MIPNQKTLSYNQKIPDEHGSSENDYISNMTNPNEIPNDHQVAFVESLQKELSQILSSLDKRGEKIIKMYYGVLGEAPKTMEEIGEVFGLTRERVRQLREAAIRKLKHKPWTKNLKQYLGD